MSVLHERMLAKVTLVSMLCLPGCKQGAPPCMILLLHSVPQVFSCMPICRYLLPTISTHRQVQKSRVVPETHDERAMWCMAGSFMTCCRMTYIIAAQTVHSCALLHAQKLCSVVLGVTQTNPQWQNLLKWACLMPYSVVTFMVEAPSK